MIGIYQISTNSIVGLVADSVRNCNLQDGISCDVSTVSSLDTWCKIATVIIALANVGFAIYIFLSKNKKEDRINEQGKRIGLLKTLILDHTMKNLYSFFESLLSISDALKTEGLTDDQKKLIDDKLADEFQSVRYRFVDAFLAVDETLYDTILHTLDDLQGHLSTSIFDRGINLFDLPKYQEVFTGKITQTKTELLKVLLQYRG